MKNSLDRFLRYHQSINSPKATLRYYSQNISYFIAFLSAQNKSIDISALSIDNLRLWLVTMRQAGLSDSTIATRARAIKVWSNWLTNEEFIDKNPLAKFKIPLAVQPAKPVFTPEDVEKLLYDCDRKTLLGLRDYAIILLLYSTGLRATELTTIKKSDIDWKQSLITLPKTKTHKLRVIPLAGKTERAIDRYLSKRKDHNDSLFLSRFGNPLDYDTLRHMLDRHGLNVGLHVNPHKFRHSSAIAYLRAGGKVENLKSLLGHSSIDMVLHYARITGIDLTEGHLTADPVNQLRVR